MPSLADRGARGIKLHPWAERRGPRVLGIHLVPVAAAVARMPGLPLPEVGA